MTKFRNYFLALVFSVFFSIATPLGIASADPAQLISDPTGTQVNGWYTEHPTVTVRAVCNGSPYGNSFAVDIAGWSWSGGGSPSQAQPGRHYIELLSNDISNIYINNDGVLSPYLAGGCANPDGSTPSTVLWQGYIQWDETAPTVSITSPADNSNEDNSSITVAGDVSDDASGVASVTVNGVAANINNSSSYSAQISLQTGINTINVVAKDNAGHQSSKSETVFLREIPQSSAGSSKSTTGTTNTTTNNSTAPSVSNQPSSSQSPATGSSKVTANKPTDNFKLVKTVATGTGVSLATILLIIVIMLALDRLGIIEIKLFSDYHQWRKSHYKKLKARLQKGD